MIFSNIVVFFSSNILSKFLISYSSIHDIGNGSFAAIDGIHSYYLWQQVSFLVAYTKEYVNHVSCYELAKFSFHHVCVCVREKNFIEILNRKNRIDKITM